jgi:Fic/DOC family
VTVFREIALPAPARLAGYAWLIDRYALTVPTPPRLAAVAGHHRARDIGRWMIRPESYEPDPTLAGHVAFAFKYEGVDLAVLAALFRVVPDGEVAAAVQTAPTGAYMRRLWFLHEWITGRRLDLPDLGKVRVVDAVDPKLQVALATGASSPRHRVRDNLPGTREFCPMVRWTTALRAYVERDLKKRASAIVARTHSDVIGRAAAFLLLKDSRASFTIEKERPPRKRLARWGQAIARAGAVQLTAAELDALQRTVIGDGRFVEMGLRRDGGFVGEHDRVTREPLPQHVSAKPDDLPSLVRGIIEFDQRAGSGAIDPVAAAAALAFGFVYVHPFEDGNGRIHRWLIHHVLAAAGYAPPGIVFPVSAVMLRELEAYRRVLESYSTPLLACIDWRPTDAGNVEVLNDTADWYRYFDATAHAEFLHHCVAEVVDHDLPREVAYLAAYDRFAEGVQAIADMPSRTIDLLHRFLGQHGGKLSRRARDKEFAALTDAEVEQVETLYANCDFDAADRAEAELPDSLTTNTA